MHISRHRFNFTFCPIKISAVCTAVLVDWLDEVLVEYLVLETHGERAITYKQHKRMS